MGGVLVDIDELASQILDGDRLAGMPKKHIEDVPILLHSQLDESIARHSLPQFLAILPMNSRPNQIGKSHVS